MINPRPLILITNDDGVSAPGMACLIDCVASLGADVIAVGPVRPQSGKSSALTVDAPLRISSRPDRGDARIFAVDGTPVDCVKLALDAIVPRRPDLLLSGINHGSNSGTAVLYSGTMGAVIEGCCEGISSVGFSLLHHSIQADFSLSAPMVTEIASAVLRKGLPAGVCLNVNIPARITPRGARVCRAARGHWSEEYRRYVDPNGQPFYWLTGRFVNEEPDARDTDEYWLGQGYMSVVPVAADMSAVGATTQIATLLSLPPE